LQEMPQNLTMKKLGLFIGSALLCTFSFAQHMPKLGVKAGLNVATIKWNTDMDSRLGFHGGLVGHIHLSPNIALQPEVLYSAEGAKQSTSMGEVTWKNDYINIPLMLQYMFNNGFRIEAGPQLGLLLDAKSTAEGFPDDNTEDVFKSTNVGLGFGLNYLSYSGFGIGGRYILGLSKINETNWPEAKGRNLQISVFYMLDNNHKAKSR